MPQRRALLAPFQENHFWDKDRHIIHVKFPRLCGVYPPKLKIDFPRFLLLDFCTVHGNGFCITVLILGKPGFVL